MSISLYSGTVGSGKSLHTAREIKEKLRWGCFVISTVNIDTRYCFLTRFQERRFNHIKSLDKEKLSKKREAFIKKKYKFDAREKNFRFIDILKITPQYLYKFAALHHVEGKERQTYLYLDECVAIFSPTCPVMQDLKKWEEWQTFFRECRQLGYEVILVPQSAKLLSRKVVECCELEVRHLAQKHHGTAGFFLSLIFGGLFTASTYWRGEKRNCQYQEWYKYKPLYGSMYNSYTLFEGALRPYREEYQWERMLAEEQAEQEQRQIYLGKFIAIIGLRQQILVEAEISERRENLEKNNNGSINVSCDDALRNGCANG